MLGEHDNDVAFGVGLVVGLAVGWGVGDGNDNETVLFLIHGSFGKFVSPSSNESLNTDLGGGHSIVGKVLGDEVSEGEGDDVSEGDGDGVEGDGSYVDGSYVLLLLPPLVWSLPDFVLDGLYDGKGVIGFGLIVGWCVVVSLPDLVPLVGGW